MVEKAVSIEVLTSELVKRMNEDSRRIRLLEQRMDRIDNTVSGLEDNILAQLDNLKFSIEKLNSEILRIGERITGMENEMNKLKKDLDKTATKTEIKQIETFIDVVNPITSKFVTKDEMERVLEEMTTKPKKA
jgi:predicted RNase H-like nuclease (RuvC/YqgF family)